MARVKSRSWIYLKFIGFVSGFFAPGFSAFADESGPDQFAPYYQPPPEFAGNLDSYHSPLLFSDGATVKTKEDWVRRRKEILQMWHDRLGEWPELLEEPKLKFNKSESFDGFVRFSVTVQIYPDGSKLDAYLLIPDGEGPFPAVLIPFYEPETSVGEKGRGTHAYGLELVKRGFVTLSIGTPGVQQHFGFGTREALVEAGKERRIQPLTQLAYVAANCHTALAQHHLVDAGRIGIIGLSYGGKWAMFSSCLYDKFACAVWSDPGIVFNEKNSNVNYWEPWYLGYDPKVSRKPGVPSEDNPRTGLYRKLVASGQDLVSLHALMAPRPVLVSGGTEDPPRNWLALNHLVQVNRVLGFENRVAMTSRKTHVPTPEALELELAFLEQFLKPGEKPKSAQPR